MNTMKILRAVGWYQTQFKVTDGVSVQRVMVNRFGSQTLGAKIVKWEGGGTIASENALLKLLKKPDDNFKPMEKVKLLARMLPGATELITFEQPAQKLELIKVLEGFRSHGDKNLSNMAMQVLTALFPPPAPDVPSLDQLRDPSCPLETILRARISGKTLHTAGDDAKRFAGEVLVKRAGEDAGTINSIGKILESSNDLEIIAGALKALKDLKEQIKDLKRFELNLTGVRTTFVNIIRARKMNDHPELKPILDEVSAEYTKKAPPPPPEVSIITDQMLGAVQSASRKSGIVTAVVTLTPEDVQQMYNRSGTIQPFAKQVEEFMDELIAARDKAMSAEMTACLEVEHLNQRIIQLQGELATAGNRIASMVSGQQPSQAQKEEITRLTENLVISKKAIENMNAQVKVLEGTIESHNRTITELGNEIGQVQAEIASLTAKKNAAEIENKQTNERAERVARELQAVRLRMTRMVDATALDEANARIGLLESNLQTRADTIQRLERGLGKATTVPAELVELEKAAEHIMAEVKGIEQSVELLTGEYSDNDGKIKRFQSLIDEFRANAKSFRGVFAEVKAGLVKKYMADKPADRIVYQHAFRTAQETLQTETDPGRRADAMRLKEASRAKLRAFYAKRVPQLKINLQTEKADAAEKVEFFTNTADGYLALQANLESRQRNIRAEAANLDERKTALQKESETVEEALETLRAGLSGRIKDGIARLSALRKNIKTMKLFAVSADNNTGSGG